jgi:hypothetical protein
MYRLITRSEAGGQIRLHNRYGRLPYDKFFQNDIGFTTYTLVVCLYANISSLSEVLSIIFAYLQMP